MRNAIGWLTFALVTLGLFSLSPFLGMAWLGFWAFLVWE